MLIAHQTLKAKALFWHYTTWDGLKGILGSSTLWATSFAYLNDERELSRAAELFNAAVTGERESVAPGFFGTRHATDPIWVTSFSAAFDSLPQWRAYTTGIGGFAIGFSGRALQSLAPNYRGRFAECLYTEDRQRSVIEDYAAPVRAQMADSKKILDDPATTPQRRSNAMKGSTLFRRHQFDLFYERAPEIKDPSFASEEEWRIICRGPFVHVRDDWTIDRGFHTKGSMLAPHIELQLPDQTADSPIGGIMVGPGPHLSLNTDSINRLLTLTSKKTGNPHFELIPVATSNVPYRAW
jgi:hypothetical protein